jgi:hypothetical protein
MRAVFDHPSVDTITAHLIADVIDVDLPTSKREGPSPTERNVPTGAALNQTGLPSSFSLQERRWLSLIENAGYGHRVVPIVFSTNLDNNSFLLALRWLIGRHESLRVQYDPEGARCLDIGACVPDLDELFIDVSTKAAAEGARIVATLVDTLRANIPDPRQEPSWTLRCIRTTREQFIVLLSLQHIDFDGNSLSTFAEELRDTYVAYRDGGKPCGPPAVQYREYVKWQLEATTKHRDSALEFFRGLYTGFNATTVLADHPGFSKTRALPSLRYTPAKPELSARRLIAAAARLGVSPFALVLGSYAAIVAEAAHDSQIVISTISGGRFEERFMKTIGPFTTPFPMPLRTGGLDRDKLALHAHAVATAVIARAAQFPTTELTQTLSCFRGFPEDTYFTDVAINFTNYRKVEPASIDVEVLEILGPVDLELLAAVDFGKLTRVPGLHLVFDASGAVCRPNFWYHVDRFSANWVEGIAHDFALCLANHVDALLA